MINKIDQVLYACNAPLRQLYTYPSHFHHLKPISAQFQLTIEELDIICKFSLNDPYYMSHNLPRSVWVPNSVHLSFSGQIPHHCVVSAEHGWCLDDLLETIWDYLNMLRIYTKPKGQIPDYAEPGLACFTFAPSIQHMYVLHCS